LTSSPFFLQQKKCFEIIQYCSIFNLSFTNTYTFTLALLLQLLFHRIISFRFAVVILVKNTKENYVER